MEKMIEVCPITSIKKEDTITSFKKESEKWEKENIYPFSKYAKEKYPDVCVGNCEECKNWKSIGEKELWLKNNDTLISHAKYETELFAGNYILSLPITLIASPIMYGNFKSAFLMSFGIAMAFRFLHFLVGFGATSFEDWLERKWRNLQN